MDEFRKQPDSYTTLGVYRKAECIYDITTISVTNSLT